MDEYACASATERAGALREKRIASRELLDLYLRPIERFNPAINAVVTVAVNGTQRRTSDTGAWAGLSDAYDPLSTVAPVGRTPADLPVGVQIVGPYLEDRTTIDVARRLAGLIGGFVAPPGYESSEAVAEGAQR